MRKIVIIIGVVTVIGGAFATLYYVTKSENRIATGQISDRAKAYIKDQQTGNDTVWRSVDLDQSTQGSKSTTIDKNGCFSLVLPFRVKAERPEDGCAVDITTDEPTGLFVASLKPVAVDRLDDVAAVRLRREREQDYTEDVWNVNGREYLTFRSKDGLYKRSVFYLTSYGVFTMSLNINTNADLDPQMKETLETLEFE